MKGLHSIVLAWDPGLTTGFAVVDKSRNLLLSGELSFGEFIKREWQDWPLPVWRSPVFTRAPLVVAETTFSIRKEDNEKIQEICRILKEVFPKIKWIRPSSWKPVITAHRALKIPQHARDAVGIAFYAIEYYFGRRRK